MDDNTLPPISDGESRNVFQDWGSSSPQPLDSNNEQSQEDYSAANLTQAEEGIAFFHENGVITVKFYRHLQGVVCLPPYRMLSLLYMDCVYLLEGYNLNLLISRIRRHRLGELYCYDPERHPAPREGVVVLRITEKSFEDIDAESGDDR